MALKALTVRELINRGLVINEEQKTKRLREELEDLAILPGDFSVRGVVVDVETLDGSVLGQEVWEEGIQKMMSVDTMRQEIGQRIRVTREESDEGPKWSLMVEGKEGHLVLARKKNLVRGWDVMSEGSFEEGKLKRKLWRRVGEEPWRRGLEIFLWF